MENNQSNYLQQSQDTIKTPSVTDKANWAIADSERLYNVRGWGEPYFFIDRSGNLVVNLKFSSPKKSLDLYELVKSLTKQGLNPPILFHFPDILADRIARLYSCMAEAIARYHYLGNYQGVFPLKCNQSLHLVEALVNRDRTERFGLEVGSKPELIIAIAKLKPQSGSRPLLIVNGYKDRQYLETALLASKLDYEVIIVIERLQELYLALEISQRLKIEPILGVRAKLNTQGTGRWGKSTGDRAKFGLTSSEILQLVRELSAADKLDYLQLLHFHIGSQISAISAIKAAICEASQIYVQLAKIGANMRYLDVGGGLAIDYDGSKTNRPSSKNYSLQNYANDIVAQVKDACDRGGVTVPTLISESGTAIAAPHAVLVTNVLGTNSIPAWIQRSQLDDEPLVMRNFWETFDSIDKHNYQERYHDAIQFKQEALSLFNFGYLSLEQRAIAEELYWGCCRKIAKLLENQDYLPEDLRDLEGIMASVYYLNLSVFQSLPDAWATEGLFPIMPLHRLNERPTVKATLADLTCDSDGKIDRFIGLRDNQQVLELHSGDRHPYYLGIFLVGAYQETMGNLHNLFGKTNLVQVRVNAEGKVTERVVRGDKIKDVLADIDYDAEDLLKTLHLFCQEAWEKNLITSEEATKLIQNYQDSMFNYTYLAES